MGEKLVVGPINKGLRTDREPFVIDNDSFPTLINAYQWRGRIKRKRGTNLLGRLRRFIDTTDAGGNATVPISPVPIISGIVSFVIGTDVFYDPGGPSPVTLITNSVSGTAVLDRVTGILTITGSIPLTQVIYYPTLPVMGLEDFLANANQFPGTIAFDTKYSYNISTSAPFNIYDVSFYKNPLADSLNLPNYVRKTNWTPLHWNGQDYRQFWTTNYQGAMWATNGVEVPFTGTTVGMQFKAITGVAIVIAGNGVHGPGNVPAEADITIVNHGLVRGDFIYVNEVQGITGINFQTGYVTSADPQVANVVRVTFPFAILGGAYISGGIAQYLTNTAIPGVDPIRWYDGDPTGGLPPFPSSELGWVNFSPPLSQFAFSISDLPPDIYYLAGARMILQFKDRLLAIGPVVQTSSGSPIYLQDTVIYSQNGTPYYTASFKNTPNVAIDTPTSASNVFFPILVPINQTATATAWFEDSTGFGGFIAAGLDIPIITTSPNEDVLIMGFTTKQARFVYTGNDIVPFNFFVINSEFGSSSTFSSVTMDKGVLSKGSRAYIVTSQTGAQRIDLEIPDTVFDVNLSNNGNERICSNRDFINEWVYWTFPTNLSSQIYPNTTLQYNYRDDSWAIFYESYTTYGIFRRVTGYTWLTIPWAWQDWAQPWNAGSTSSLQPIVIAGNQQGFVMQKTDDTDEDTSLTIQNLVSTLLTSPSHNLNEGDYILITGALGTIGAEVNGQVFQVGAVTTDTFLIVSQLVPIITGTYLGGGLITRIYNPFIQTKQFPVAWSAGRKVRIGAQQYLLSTTDNGQISLLIFLSQNDEDAYNDGPIVPTASSINNTLVYSTTLFTSPEYYTQTCTNIPLGNIGDGVSLSYNLNYQVLFNLITPGLVPGTVFISVGNVATFTDNGTGGFTATGTGTSVGSSIDYQTATITIAFTVAPNSQTSTTNFNYFVTDIQSPTAQDQEQIWHRINTSLLGDTVQLGFTMSDAQLQDPTLSNQFAEIEIHGFVIDVNASQMLS